MSARKLKIKNEKNQHEKILRLNMKITKIEALITTLTNHKNWSCVKKMVTKNLHVPVQVPGKHIKIAKNQNCRFHMPKFREIVGFVTLDFTQSYMISYTKRNNVCQKRYFQKLKSTELKHFEMTWQSKHALDRNLLHTY